MSHFARGRSGGSSDKLPTEHSMPLLSREVFNTLASFTVYALFLLNWQYGGLRFTSSLFNHATLAAALFLPALGVYWVAKLPSRQQRLLSLIPLSIVALASGIVCVAVLLIGNKRQLLKTLMVHGVPVRAYRTYQDDLLGDHSSIIIEQERSLLPGLIWVTSLHKERGTRDVTMAIRDGHHVRCVFPDQSGLRAAKRVTLQVP